MKDTLQHHGVKGMKWGVRRTPEQLGHRPSRSERRIARAAQRQARRDSIADQYRKDSRQELKDLSESHQQRIVKAQKKLQSAKERGASERKVKRLERTVTDRQIRAHVDKVREQRMSKDTEKYLRKTPKEKLKDPKFWEAVAGKSDYETYSYRDASSKAYESARKKYGDETVTSLVRRDTAKQAAILTGAAVIYGYSTYKKSR